MDTVSSCWIPNPLANIISGNSRSLKAYTASMNNSCCCGTPQRHWQWWQCWQWWHTAKALTSSARPMSRKVSVPHTSEVGTEAALGPLQHLLGPTQGVSQSLSAEQEGSLQLGTGRVWFSLQSQTERCEVVSTRPFLQSRTESPFAIEKQ